MSLMKNIIIASIISCIVFVKGYTQQSRITYEAILNKELIDSKLKSMPLDYQAKFSQKIQNIESLKFFLYFENGKSWFHEDEIMTNDGRRKWTFLNTISGKGFFFSDQSSDFVINQKESFGEDFLVEIPKVIWNLTNEKQMINNYECFKATTILRIENSDGVHELAVTAWYTLDIPTSFGPKHYMGLPGLVIRLYERSLILNVTNIEFNIKEKIVIKAPEKGTYLKLSEFNKMSKGVYEGNK